MSKTSKSGARDPLSKADALDMLVSALIQCRDAGIGVRAIQMQSPDGAIHNAVLVVAATHCETSPDGIIRMWPQPAEPQAVTP